jgi:hypothetical protein
MPDEPEDDSLSGPRTARRVLAEALAARKTPWDVGPARQLIEARVKWDCARVRFGGARSSLQYAAAQFARFGGPSHAHRLERCAIDFEHRRLDLCEARSERRAAQRAFHQQDNAA